MTWRWLAVCAVAAGALASMGTTYHCKWYKTGPIAPLGCVSVEAGVGNGDRLVVRLANESQEICRLNLRKIVFEDRPPIALDGAEIAIAPGHVLEPYLGPGQPELDTSNARDGTRHWIDLEADQGAIRFQLERHCPRGCF